MEKYKAENIVNSFNACIKERDVDTLSTYMTEDRTFIDSAGNIVAGKTKCISAWKGFFSAFPDYRNHVEAMTFIDNMLIVTGDSVCFDERLSGLPFGRQYLAVTRLRNGGYSRIQQRIEFY